MANQGPYLKCAVFAIVLCANFKASEGSSNPIEDVPKTKWKACIEQWDASIAPLKPRFDINTAWITVKSLVDDRLQLFWQNDQCFGCALLWVGEVPPQGNISKLLATKEGRYIDVRKPINATYSEIICSDHRHRLAERGDYWLIVYLPTNGSTVHCDLILANDPPNVYLPILYAFLIFLGLAIIWIIIKKMYRRHVCSRCRRNYASHDLEPTSSTTVLELSTSSNSVDHNEVNGSAAGLDEKTSTATVTEKSTPAKPPPTRATNRLRSLDAFRGFSLMVMIFVNYGGGSYYFFEHASWNGLYVADLVYPWFIWIMGTSMAFSFKGMERRGIPKWRRFLKIIERTCKIFALGIFMATSSNNDLKKLRVPGVLQRIAFTYLIVSLTHFGFATAEDKGKNSKLACIRDVFVYWVEWIIMLAILALHLGLTFGLPVPGCPTGYLGPGGLHDGGKYFNCSGGAAGYIDIVFLKENHLYQWAETKTLYKATMPYDPEGVLGTFSSIFMCFIGLQAGKIIMTFPSHKGRVIRWLVWAIITGAIGTLLCKGTQNDGWIPVNKNLWSVSFSLVLSSMAFVLLALMYLIIDVGRLWTGAPFVYPGMNSIVVYFCHSAFGSYFPVSWQWPDYTLHWQRLFRAVWGTCVWIVIAYIMYIKKIFVAL